MIGMANSLPKLDGATERKTLADVCGKQIKAGLHPEHAQEGASLLRDVAADALTRIASQKAAATDIGIHESRLSHKLDEGSLTIAQLEKLGPAYAAELGRRLVDVYGPLVDPKQRARRQIREARRAIDELADYIEYAG